MAMILDIISWAFFLSGGAFLILGAIGMLRLPDVFARMHPTGLIDTMGSGLIILGMAFQVEWSIVTVKLMLIVVFIFFSTPTATHALARAALGAGLKPMVDPEPGKTKPAELNDQSQIKPLPMDQPMIQGSKPGEGAS